MLVFVLRILAAEFVVEAFTLWCRADPDVAWSHPTRVAEVLDELKKSILLGF